MVGFVRGYREKSRSAVKVRIYYYSTVPNGYAGTMDKLVCSFPYKINELQNEAHVA